MTKINPNGVIAFPFSSVRFDFTATIPGNGAEEHHVRIDVGSVLTVEDSMDPTVVQTLFRKAADAMIDGLRRLAANRQGITPTEE